MPSGIEIASGIKILNPFPIDAWSGPYTSVANANSAILPTQLRYKSMIVRIVNETTTELYWYKNGITDADLVPFNEESTPLMTGTSWGDYIYWNNNTQKWDIGRNEIKLGYNAGQINQGETSVSIGYYAGHDNQYGGAVAIGNNAGKNAQGEYATAIGCAAGQFSQSETSVAIGYYAGQSTQGADAVAIGNSAGQNTQGTNAVAIGSNSGNQNQGTNAVAIGSNSGNQNQGTGAVAIGNNAGQTNQESGAVAIGFNSGNQNQRTGAVAIGSNAGQNTQGTNAVAIGYNTGNQSQGIDTVAIGYNAGQINQGTDSVAIGNSAGNKNQNIKAISIGAASGQNTQGSGAIAIGYCAGRTDQGVNAVAIGYNTGSKNQGTNAIAIGNNAGQNTQSTNAVAIGSSAGQTNQGANAVAIGSNAGNQNQGINAIAIGNNAGCTQQASDSIIINASTIALNTISSGFYVNPIRSTQSITHKYLKYNTSTCEISYDNNTIDTFKLGVSTVPSYPNKTIQPLLQVGDYDQTYFYGSDKSSTLYGVSSLIIGPGVKPLIDILSTGDSSEYDPKYNSFAGLFVATNKEPSPNVGGAITLGGRETFFNSIIPFARLSGVSAASGINGDLVFETLHQVNGARTGLRERMRITYDGNVGIGTATPQEKFDIVGNLHTSGYVSTDTIQMSNGIINNVSQILSNGQLMSRATSFSYDVINNASNTNSFKIELQGSNLIINKNNYTNGIGTLLKNTGSGQLVLGTDNPVIYINGSLTGNNKVGIGIDNPKYDLDISGNLRIGYNSGNTSSFGIYLGRSGKGNDRSAMISSDGTNMNISNQQTGKLSFGTDNNDKITILPSGNVGIGNNNPQEKLEVNGNIKINMLDSDNHSVIQIGANNGYYRLSVTRPDATNTGGTYKSSIDIFSYFPGVITHCLQIKPTGDIYFPKSVATKSLNLANGTADKPALFFNDTDTGLYGISDGQMGISANGQERIKITNSIDLTPNSGSDVNIYSTLNLNNNSIINCNNVVNSLVAGSGISISGGSGNNPYTGALTISVVSPPTPTINDAYIIADSFNLKLYVIREYSDGTINKNTSPFNLNTEYEVYSSINSLTTLKNCKYVLIGGGGGGGGSVNDDIPDSNNLSIKGGRDTGGAGGGGSGAFIFNPSYSLTGVTTIKINIGSGGNGANVVAAIAAAIAAAVAAANAATAAAAYASANAVNDVATANAVNAANDATAAANAASTAITSDVVVEYTNNAANAASTAAMAAVLATYSSAVTATAFAAASTAFAAANAIKAAANGTASSIYFNNNSIKSTGGYGGLKGPLANKGLGGSDGNNSVKFGGGSGGLGGNGTGHNGNLGNGPGGGLGGAGYVLNSANGGGGGGGGIGVLPVFFNFNAVSIGGDGGNATEYKKGYGTNGTNGMYGGGGGGGGATNSTGGNGGGGFIALHLYN